MGLSYSAERLRLFDALVSMLFVFLLLARIQQALSGNIVALALAVQAGVTAFLLVFHWPTQQASSWQMELVAWLSAFVPLAMNAPSWPASIWTLPGLIVSIWALMSLGGAFSIVPVDRGLVCRGPYGWVRHPMYAGELLSLLGLCIANPLAWNWLVLLIFALSVYRRVAAEESLLGDSYRDYAAAIRWRFIPGIC
jgi:protein-S-isoprenylcysteine O-methyltransferase Ste14